MFADSKFLKTMPDNPNPLPGVFDGKRYKNLLPKETLDVSYSDNKHSYELIFHKASERPDIPNVEVSIDGYAFGWAVGTEEALTGTLEKASSRLTSIQERISPEYACDVIDEMSSNETVSLNYDFFKMELSRNGNTYSGRVESDYSPDLSRVLFEDVSPADAKENVNKFMLANQKLVASSVCKNIASLQAKCIPDGIFVTRGAEVGEEYHVRMSGGNVKLIQNENGVTLYDRTSRGCQLLEDELVKALWKKHGDIYKSYANACLDDIELD